MGISRVSLALGAAVMTIGAVTASAASLGGITAESVGADDTVIASCDDDGIGAAATTVYDAVSGTYQVNNVELSGVDAACDGLDYKVTLADGSFVSLGEETGTLTVVAGDATIPVSPNVSAEAYEHLAVVITG